MAGLGFRQPYDSFSGPLSEGRAASAAAGGTALSTTAVIVGFPNGTSHVAAAAWNFVTGVVCQFALNPTLSILKTADNFLSVTGYTVAGQQNPATASAIGLSAFDTLANGNALLIGAYAPFRGVAVTMSGNVNAVASVLSVSYWNGAWTAVSGLSDGTAIGGATFAQTGNITWTVPTDAVKQYLGVTKGYPVNSIVNAGLAFNLNGTDATVSASLANKLYWTRFTTSAAFTVNTAANTMFALNRSTTYAEMLGSSLLQFRVPIKGVDILGVSCIEAKMNAGTGSLIVNCYTDDPTTGF